MDRIVIIDFGSQTAQLSARRVREAQVFCRVLPCTAELSEIEDVGPAAIILSGGPASVWEGGSPRCASQVFHMGVPILGLCYGMQLLCEELGGDVEPSDQREFGRAALSVVDAGALFEELPDSMDVWMSHGDRVESLPEGFVVAAESDNAPFAAVRHETKPIYGLQFHPEVVHTPTGREILRNFLFRVAGLRGDWEMSSFIEQSVAAIREQVGPARVICGLSGGVDSAVVAALLHRAVGDQLTCIFVDNGLLRSGEADLVEEAFRPVFGDNLIVARAEERFLEKLAGVTDPERKLSSS